jgi:hypothetical protein
MHTKQRAVMSCYDFEMQCWRVLPGAAAALLISAGMHGACVGIWVKRSTGFAVLGFTTTARDRGPCTAPIMVCRTCLVRS